MKIKFGNLFEYNNNIYLTGEEIKKKIILRSNEIKKAGTIKKKNIIISHGNTNDFFIDLFAVWTNGGCAICIDNTLSVNEIKNIINQTSSKILLFKKNEKKYAELRNKINLVQTNKNYSLKNIHPQNIKINFNSNNNALILYTSGTTGTPKGVVHTFKSLNNKWNSLSKIFKKKDLKNTLCTLPTHFGHGLICNCLFPFFLGCTLHILPKFNLSLLINLGKIIDKFKITYLSSVPTIWRIVTANSKKPKRKTLKLITCGSSPLSKILWKKIQNWSGQKKIWNTYGITETGSWIAGTSLKKIIPDDGFIGKPWGIKIKILRIKPDEIKKLDKRTISKNNLKKNQRGYIWVKTNTLMKEYYKLPNMTKNVVKDGWFFTGDIGYLKQKNLFINGRERNEINVSGIKVVPEDIDMILERNKNIIEACTFSEKDEITGEKVCCAIVRKQKRLDEEYFKSYCRKNFSDHKIPKKIYFIDEIPKTPRGKLNRELVKNYCLNTRFNN